MAHNSGKTYTVHLAADAGPEAHEMQPVLTELVNEIGHNLSKNLSDLESWQAVRRQDAAYQGRLLLAVADAKAATYQSPLVVGDNVPTPNGGRVGMLLSTVLAALVRGPLNLSEADWLRLLRLFGLDFATPDPQTLRDINFRLPLPLALAAVEKWAKKNGLGEALQAFLQQLLRSANPNHPEVSHYGKGDMVKIRAGIQKILSLRTEADALPVVEFLDGDAFGQHLTQFAQSLAPADPATVPWLRLLQLWQNASGAQPSAKFAKELAAAVAAIDPAVVRERGRGLLAALAAVRPEEKTVTHTHTWDNGEVRTWNHTSTVYLLEPDVNIAKGLIWTLQPLLDEALVAQLADYAVRCYQKIPGQGPMAAGLGNACLAALASYGLPGVAALARVRSKIKQTNTQELIGRHIEKASQELGVSPAEIEDMAVLDFGLENGQLVETYDEYTATLTLAEGKAEVAWHKAGKPLKSAPAALKATHADELKELKLAQTTAQQTYTTQRDRLDRSFISGRQIPWPWFAQYYFHHGLLHLLAYPLIWRLHHADGSFHDALYLQEQWQDAHGQPVPTPLDTDAVQLWHPVLSPTEQVLAWRALLEKARLRQPLKQAFREVYLLTPPEERTHSYSNRMAAHILKQHQFNSLAKLRGWKYSLLGAYDKGYESDKATLALPAHDLQAEFWVSEVDADDAFNDTGIWYYISTDQVRFVRPLRPADAVPLPEIPALTFSEVMRDVDLFVGVASVANDPNWRDNGGLVQYQNYWESYSFGDLGEVAKNRKLILERLVPRLKIAKVSEIRDKFLVVRGKRRTYKIHLGSGNILMEPNDQYLCIVPDRSPKSVASDVFLPFEGDAVLSIILSKALLLMDDDKITDDTINRQIGRSA
ncbi:MAG: DUF4132 domain-containing protein [Janthinobacterium lividum]